MTWHAALHFTLGANPNATADSLPNRTDLNAIIVCEATLLRMNTQSSRYVVLVRGVQIGSSGLVTLLQREHHSTSEERQAHTWACRPSRTLSAP